MCKNINKMLSNPVITLILGFIIGYFTNSLWDYTHRIKLDKIVGYYPYANDYYYADGKKYKGASSNEENMTRPIDPKDPLPLKLGKEEYKLTLGIKNFNSKQLKNVIFFLKIPMDSGIKVTNYSGWAKNSEYEFYTVLGDINQDMLVRDHMPIYISIKNSGFHNLSYDISGDFPIIRERQLPLFFYK